MKHRVCINEIAKYSKGQQINGDNLLSDGTYAYLNGGINPSGKWSDYNVEGNTITISEGGNSCGYVNYMQHPFWCGAHCYYLYDVKGNSKYLYYALKSQQNRLMGIRSGACMPNIKKADLGNFKFNYDDNLDRQSEIISTLQLIENILEYRKNQLAMMDELIKARFVEMFGDPEQSNKYQYTILEKITNVVSGGTPNRQIYENWNNGNIPWIKTTELKNNVITHSEEYITEQGLKNSSAKVVPKGTILIAMYGQGKTRGMTGYLGIKACTNQACACILPSKDINSIYLWKYFEFSYNKLRSLAKGGNQPNLNADNIKKFSILTPPISLQQQFADFVTQVTKSKSAIQKSLDETQLLFDSLMQKYFG